MNGLEGRRYLVTGSTRGIGRAIAARLMEEGARVAVHGSRPMSAERAARDLGEGALPVAADFDDPATAAEVVRSANELLGGLDGLVNNVGVSRPVGFRGVTLEGWRRTLRINLESALLASQAAYELFRKARSGAIVNVASIAAHGPGRWAGADYAASKAALVSLTQTLALEGARFKVRVNAVSPGFVETDMTSAVSEEKVARLGIPLGRLGLPQEVAGAVAYLLSDDATYVTGTVLRVDGGMGLNG